MKNFDFSAEDLRQWQKNRQGEVFWEAIKNLFADRISKMRQEIREEKFTKAAQSEGFCEGMEEVLQLCDLLIADNKKEK